MVCAKNKKGFTLIEVLVALMIIAIALAAAVRATNESIRVTRHVRSVTIAHFVAMNVLSEIQIGMLPMSQSGNEIHGQTNMLGREWMWSATMTAQNQFDLKSVTVAVRSKKRLVVTVAGYA